MYKLIRPLLFKVSKDPETVHNVALSFLRFGGKFPLNKTLSSFANYSNPVLEQKVFGLNFKNPIGMAAGFDKDGKIVRGLEALGFGFVEVGTVTPFAQPGNVRPRMFRLPEDEALINRMGFNNHGAKVMKNNLVKSHHTKVLGVSLGKNKSTPLEKSAQDYLTAFKELYACGDYFVVNVSSPNTPGLRQLQDKSYLLDIFSALNNYRNSQKHQKPILLKIAPDLSLEAIDEALEVCRTNGVNGIIAVNTTLSRQGLKTKIEEAGGLSGKPLKEQSTTIIRHIHKLAPQLPIIGVGGIFTPEDAYQKIKAGASLVQIYTGFIYQGPFVVKQINQGLAELLKRDGYKNISEAVGVEAK